MHLQLGSSDVQGPGTPDRHTQPLSAISTASPSKPRTLARLPMANWSMLVL